MNSTLATATLSSASTAPAGTGRSAAPALALPVASDDAQLASYASVLEQSPWMSLTLSVDAQQTPLAVPEMASDTAEDATSDADALFALPSFAPLWQADSVVLRAEADAAAPITVHSAVAQTAAVPTTLRALAPTAEHLGLAQEASDRIPEPGLVAAAVSAASARVVLPTPAERDGAVLKTGAEVFSITTATGAPAESSSAAAGAARVAPSSVSSVANPQQPLLQALAQRIQVQHANGVEVATVRLDPPQWGTVEVRIQHDAAGVQVVIQASHAEVSRQLAGLADGLRQELQSRNSGEATVVVAQGRQMGGSASQTGSGARDQAQTAAQAEDEVIGQALLAWSVEG